MNSPYRPEIDGLRAMAVVLVMLFHGGLGLPGGYVGVDVFFVISGFLITGILLKECRGGEFRLSQFWLRRVRRIFPAALFMVLSVLLAGSYFLTPSEYQQLSVSALYQQCMSSNVYFSTGTDYFRGPSDLMPLLHTWSLSVEEQFYLGYPILIYLLSRFRNRTAILIVAVFAAESFAVNVCWVEHSRTSNFFLLPGRGWEMLLGGLLSFVSQSTRTSPIGRIEIVLRELLCDAGLIAIVASAYYFSFRTPFPGYAALAPCLGAAAVIMANKDRQTVMGMILSWKPIVLLGLMSYSLYLWHWPMLAFFRHRYGLELSMELRILAIGASFPVALFSWWFIERPFREFQFFRGSATRTVAWAGMGSFAVIAIAAIIFNSEGARFRLSQERLDEIAAAEENATWTGASFLTDAGKSDLPKAYVHGDLENGEVDPTVLIWADSHGCACIESIALAAKACSLKATIVAQPGAPPVAGLGVVDGRWRADGKMSCASAAEIASDPRITDVVLLARWTLHVHGRRDAEMEDLWKSRFGVGADSASEQEAEPAPSEFQAMIQKNVRELIRAGKRVWVIKQLPEANPDESREFFISREVLRAVKFRERPALQSISRNDHEQRQRRANEVIDQLEGLGAILIDPAEQLLDHDDHLVLVSENQATYRDDDHLSRYGARKFMQPVFEEIFRSISSQNSVAKKEKRLR